MFEERGTRPELNLTKLQLHLICGYGGIGRRARLRGVWETVWVQVPLSAPNKN